MCTLCHGLPIALKIFMAQYFREFRDLTSDHKTSILLTSFIPVCLVHTHMVYVL